MTFAGFAMVTLMLLWSLGLAGCAKTEPGSVLDEAKRAGLTEKDLPGSSDDYLRAMDKGFDADAVHKALRQVGVEHLSKEQAWESYNRGRNNWVVWTAGNDTLWDYLANNSFGAFDLLKTLSSHPSVRYCGNKTPYGYPAPAGGGAYGGAYGGGRAPAPYPPGYWTYDDDNCQGGDRQFFEVSRDNRWKYLGLVNEPGFQRWDPKGCDWKNDKVTASEPYGKCGDPKRFGLWLDQRVGAADPFEDEKKYPGVKIGARGGTVPVGSYYGYASGIVGLRVFPNPAFDEKAKKKWDPIRYYTDEKYYNDKDLVRPYRVGMSCGFCHVGPSPIDPPADPEKPEWKNLNSNPGAQYFWIDRIFFWNPQGRHTNFIYQLFHTSLPGSLDTSLVSSDNINNPRTMNAVYNLAARLGPAKLHAEALTRGELNNKQFNDYERTKALSAYYTPPKCPDCPGTAMTPHVLKDGADSVGVLGALNRVYLNIGLFSEEWLLHFKPLIGNLPGKRITPIEIAVLQKNSTYWNANVAQTPDVALFFLASASPDRLADAPGGKAFMTTDAKKLGAGKIVFAENCARCHSGKQPANLCPLGSPCKDGDIIENSAGYFAWMRAEVMKPDFLENNFLSTERRYPVTELGTNACSPLATNGVRDNIWDNFSSTTYKELPAVGKFTVHDPLTGRPYEYEMPGDGRGYTRPASLVGVWSTAPYLLNNAVGPFYGEPSVEARLASFNASIQEMLWPEKRQKDSVLGDKVPGYIQRTTSTSSLKVAWGYLPGKFSWFMGLLGHWFPKFFDVMGLVIGPIPKGTPVALLSNLPLVSDSLSLDARVEHTERLLKLLHRLKKDLKALPKDATDAQAVAAFSPAVPELLRLSKCPDFVVNRGHYFGSNLSDDDKWALIEFLKTF